MDSSTFDTIGYLAGGNAMQQQVYALLTSHGIMEALHQYHPLLVGTIPIDIAIASSDLDIICCYADAVQFEHYLIEVFGRYDQFQSTQTIINKQQTVLATFTIDKWPFEIFGQQLDTKLQNGYRHMIVEHRLLEQHGGAFRRQIINLKQQGLKTEPAFAKALNIEGDAYAELLKLF